MKRNSLVTIVSIAMILLSITASAAASIPETSTTYGFYGIYIGTMLGSNYVLGHDVRTMPIELPGKYNVEGNFNVSDGTIAGRNSMLDFWVTDPKGNTILNLGEVYEGVNFSFTANIQGNYTLNFQNNIDTTKTFEYEYTVSKPITDPIINGLTIGILLLVIVLAIGGLVLYKVKKKKVGANFL